MLKRTPLYAAHQRLGARLIEFGGWEMPVQYSSILDEHLAVRKSAGLFDISHMGELLFSGPGAQEFLNHTLTNDLRKLAVGQGQYTLMCNERGGVIDDLYAYRTGESDFLLIVNASRIEVDAAWMEKQFAGWEATGARRPGGAGGMPVLLAQPVKFENASDRFGAVALQGPRAVEFIDACFPGPSARGTHVARASELRKNQFGVFPFDGQEIYLARTGYTGEDGFEVVAPSDTIEAIWNKILSVGHAFCLQPAGLGARDTLRTEVCYPLYGHELDEETTPLEAGVGSFVALDKGQFTGRSVLATQKVNGVTKKCVAFKVDPKAAPPRPQYPLWSTGPNSAPIGKVVSGTQSPSLGVGIGMGYVPVSFAAPGTPLEIEIRGKRVPAVTVPKPIYRRPA